MTVHPSAKRTKMRRTGSILVSLAFITLPFAASFSQDSREISKTVPLKLDGQVSIDTYKGSITVSVWDKPSIEIHAIIEADDEFRDKYSEEKVRETEILIDNTESSVRIKTNYDKINEHRRGFFSLFDDTGSLPLVHYTIKMPSTANLRIKDYKSRTVITGIRSEVDLNTYKGTVELSDLEGSLRLETYKGEARISFAKMKERSRVETYKGDITIAVPKNLGFDLDSDLGYRTDFRSDFDLERRAPSRRHSNLQFRGAVNGGGTTLVLRSTKGHIRLRQR
jgi:DUF4097 and DUF4098 domain-containing protein YvlB